MVSRKRNKGKERKAKQEETKRAVVRNFWHGWAPRDGKLLVNNAIITRCDHTLSTTMISGINGSHPVSSFMDDLFVNWLEKDISLTGNLFNTLQHQQVWNDSSYRNEAIKLLLQLGTNLLLVHDGVVQQISLIHNATFVAQVIVVLEKYGIAGEINLAINVSIAKLNDLYLEEDSKWRDLLKFFSKRINCSCLKKMHSEARKTMPKLGICHHCHESKERALLMVCSRCKVHQYCSRQCQVANWSSHWELCDTYVDAHEQMQNITAQS